VRFAPGGEHVAALSHRWQVALWQRQTGQLLHCFDVPPGLSADNAALAFSGDGRYFAFCAGTEARLWEVGSGRLLGCWSNLPPGLTDELAFTPQGELLLLRSETTDDRVPRFGEDPARYPRLCRLRALRRRGPPSVLLTLDRFNLRVLCAAVSGDGRWFAVEGHGRSRQGKFQELCVLDGWKARVQWSRPVTPMTDAAYFAFDPRGEELILFRQLHVQGPRADLLNPATGERRRTWPGVFWALGPGGERLLGEGPHRTSLYPGFTLVRGSDGAALVVLGIDSSSTRVPSFDPSGRFAVWGHTDGTVRLCDLEEVRQRLSELGLGWNEP
jgi:WD40 repeat protein